MLTDRDSIAAMIPHGDAMSVIDRIRSQSDLCLIAETSAHSRQDHPLYQKDGSSQAEWM